MYYLCICFHKIFCVVVSYSYIFKFIDLMDAQVGLPYSMVDL